MQFVKQLMKGFSGAKGDRGACGPRGGQGDFGARGGRAVSGARVGQGAGGAVGGQEANGGRVQAVRPQETLSDQEALALFHGKLGEWREWAKAKPDKF